MTKSIFTFLILFAAFTSFAEEGDKKNKTAEVTPALSSVSNGITFNVSNMIACEVESEESDATLEYGSEPTAVKAIDRTATMELLTEGLEDDQSID